MTSAMRSEAALLVVLCMVLLGQGSARHITIAGSGAGRQLLQEPAPEPICALGCFQDAFELRAVKRYLWKHDQIMTVDVCHHSAIQKGYPYFAVQFGRECWVTKGLTRAMQYGYSNECNYTCPGDRNSTCGGWLAFQLYARGACDSFSPPPPPSPPLQLTPPPPPPPPPQPPYKFSMLFQDSSVSFCKPTNDTFWTDVVEPLGGQNASICRCTNSTGGPNPTVGETITISTRFNGATAFHEVSDEILNQTTGHAEQLTALAQTPCANSPQDRSVSMLLAYPDPVNPRSEVLEIYVFACNRGQLPRNTSVEFYIAAPWRCCRAFP